MAKLGAKRGAARHTNQLTLSELDRALVADWLSCATETAKDFELGLWVGPYPEEHIHDVVALNEAMNGEPRDELDLEDVHKSPDEIRAWEKQMFTRGTERWSLYVRERVTGHIAGYTEVFWNPNRPEHLNQGATGVIPQYRNRGLGRWLKATMLEKILRERPQVKYIRTSNADSNAAMLKINLQLGFKPYQAHTVWQIETEKVVAYVKS
jgi:GNAT superfamily N-acetyltransferase